MTALENRLISYGILGRSLSDIPLEHIIEAQKSGVAEIVRKEDAGDLLLNFTLADTANSFKGDARELTDASEYVLRLRTSEWGRIVFRNAKRRAKVYFEITSMLAMCQERLSQQELKQGLSQKVCKFPVWLNLLVKDGVVSASRREDGIMRYALVWPGAEQPSGNAAAEVVLDNALLKYVRDRGVVLLSECKSEIEKICPGVFAAGESRFLDFFEENDFEIMEIRSKYISAEFIIADSNVPKECEAFTAAVGRAEQKIARLFYETIRSAFLVGKNFAVIDNGYAFELRERVRLFYDYVREQMRENDSRFLFDRRALGRMSFSVFVACVPLRYENLLAEAMICVAERRGPIPGFDPSAARARLRDNSTDGPGIVHEQAKEAAQHVKLADVLECADCTQLWAQFLRSKARIGEFGVIFNAIVRYNVFEVFEKEGYVYFAVIDDIDDYIEKVLPEITGDPYSRVGACISYALRKNYFEEISKLSQEEFYKKARLLAKDHFNMSQRSTMGYWLFTFSANNTKSYE